METSFLPVGEAVVSYLVRRVVNLPTSLLRKQCESINCWVSHKPHCMIQVNTVQVAPGDEGNIETVARTAIGTFKDYSATLKKAEVIEALRDAANKLEARET